jgi:hypothetical protein
VAVSVPSDSNGRPSVPRETLGVLSNLPRTRPQRSTPRRTAARKATAAGVAAQVPSAAANGRSSAPRARSRAAAPDAPATTAAARPPKPKPTRKAPVKARTRPAPAAAPVAEPVPLQGFESESDRAHGPVHPPGGAELVASAAEIVGELAKAGLSTGERLLRDVLSRLPLS